MKSYTRILVWIDSESEKNAVLDRAIRLAQETGAALDLVDVVDEVPVYLKEPRFGLPALSDTLVAECNERLGARAAFVREAGVKVESKALYGRAETAIAKYASDSGCDLVMVPGEPASEANRVLRLTPAPVWAVKPDASDPYQDVLACVDVLSHTDDESALNRRILESAAGLVALEGGRAFVACAYGEGAGFGPESVQMLEAVHEEAAEQLDKLVAPYAEVFPAERRLLLPGGPADAIPGVLKERDIDLIVMGTRGRTGVGGLLLGNTAERILAVADCSILAVKPT